MSQDEPLHSGDPRCIPVVNADDTDPVKSLLIDNPLLKGFLDPTSTESLTPAEQEFARVLVPQRYNGACENAGTAWDRRRAIYDKLRIHPLAEKHRKVSWPFWPWPRPTPSVTAASEVAAPFERSTLYSDAPMSNDSQMLTAPFIQSDPQIVRTDLHAYRAKIQRCRRRSDLNRIKSNTLIQEAETKEKRFHPVNDGKMVVLENKSSDMKLRPIYSIVESSDAFELATLISSATNMTTQESETEERLLNSVNDGKIAVSAKQSIDREVPPACVKVESSDAKV